MGSCYSGVGSKSCPDSTQSPIDRNNKLINCENNTDIKSKSKINKSSNSKQLSSSFENISYSEVVAKKHTDSSMSSTNRHKIPVPSSKLLSHNKVAPIKGSQELVLKKYQIDRRYSSGIDAKKEMTCDNSSSTSISSGSSLNLSKSSFKSSSSSANSVRHEQQQQHSSIPKPKSRTPTPPMPVKYAANVKNRSISHQQLKTNKLSVNNSSLINDRLNGNRTQTNSERTANENINTRNRNSIITNSNQSKTFASNVCTGIKYTALVSGLPRPQTAHIVSTASHSHNDNKMNYSSDSENRLLQYSSEKTEQVKCDQNLRQVNKPASYYYGMNKHSSPYKRPNNTNNININANTNTNINFNSNRLQFPSKPIQSSANNSQNVWQKRNSIPTNVSVKSKLEFRVTDNQTIGDNSVNSFNTNKINKSQIFLNKNKVKSEVNENISSEDTNENDILPKSIQKVKEVVPVFAQKDKIRNSLNEKLVETSPEHNSISSGNDADNRDFLIDDEICDQPELVLNSTIDKNDLVKSLHSELEGLMLKESSLPPSTPSSPTVSLLSNCSSVTLTPNTTTFRRPRPLSLVEMPDGSYGFDSQSYRSTCQDLIGIKTLLFRLHGILQNAETLNPFDHSYSQNKFYQQLLVSENHQTNDLDAFQQENLDLKRQIVLQQQMIEDKDRTIRLLQQQMAKYSNINNSYASQNIKQEKVNACSQTDRCNNAQNINPRAVSDGSNGMLVSFWISNVPAFA